MEKIAGARAFERERETSRNLTCQKDYLLVVNSNANLMREASVRITGTPAEEEEERKSVSFRVVCPEISVAAHHVILDAMNSV